MEAMELDDGGGGWELPPDSARSLRTPDPVFRRQVRALSRWSEGWDEAQLATAIELLTGAASNPVLARVSRQCIQPRLRRDFISDLPLELAIAIFQWLDFQSLLSAGAVCSRWRFIASDDSLWRGLWQRSGWTRAAGSAPLPRLLRPLSCQACLVRRQQHERQEFEQQKRSQPRANSADSGFGDFFATAAAADAAAAAAVASSTAADAAGVRAGNGTDGSADRAAPVRAPAGAAAHQVTKVSSWKGCYMERLEVEKNWLCRSYSERKLLGHDQGVAELQFDERELVSVSDDGTMRIWDLATERCVSTLRVSDRNNNNNNNNNNHDGDNNDNPGVTSLHFSNKYIVCGLADGAVRVFRRGAASGGSGGGGGGGATFLRELRSHQAAVLCVKLMGACVISGSLDNTLRIFHLNRGSCVRTLRGHTNSVLSLDFDKTKIVSASEDTTLRIWSMKTTRCVGVLTGHTAAVNCVRCSDDLIVSGSCDKTLRVWDVRTHRCIGTLEGHTAAIHCLQFDNHKVVSGAGNETLKVWDLHSGQCLHTLDEHASYVKTLQFDDSRLISAAGDGIIRLFDFGGAAAAARRRAGARGGSDGGGSDAAATVAAAAAAAAAAAKAATPVPAQATRDDEGGSDGDACTCGRQSSATSAGERPVSGQSSMHAVPPSRQRSWSSASINSFFSMEIRARCSSS